MDLTSRPPTPYNAGEGGRFSMYDELKKAMLAAVGAAAVTAEKAREAVDGLAERGEAAVEQGRAKTDELRRSVGARMDLAAQMAGLSEEELEQVRALVERLRAARAGAVNAADATEAANAADATDAANAADAADAANAADAVDDAANADDDAPGADGPDAPTA